MARPQTAPRSVENPAVEDVSLQQVMEALADPVRRSVVAQLARAGMDLSCGAFDLPVSRSTSTHHLHVLREAGVISQRYVGTTKLNALRVEELEARFPGLLPTLVAAFVREAAGPAS